MAEATCNHVWREGTLNVWIKCSVIAEGVEHPLPDRASCSVCGECFDLSPVEVAAAEAIIDGFLVELGAKRKP